MDRLQHSHPGRPGSRQDAFFLAMCHHRLGQAELARKWLEYAVKWPAGSPGAATGAAAQSDVARRLEVRALRREAETLINGENAADPKEKKA